jgi:hypothetical protein
MVRQAPVVFAVEPSEYGWSVSKGAKRLALFMTRAQAVTDVRKRRAVLKAKGRQSSVVVSGSETPTDNSPSPHWLNRVRR